MNKFLYRTLLVSVVVLVFVCLAVPSQVAFAQTRTAAKARIAGSGLSGTLSLNQSSDGYVLIDASIQGDPKILTPGLHGFHIHETGVCEGSGQTPFSSAKGHFDPGPFGSAIPVEKNHPYHLGDLPNIKVDKNGKGELKTITSRFTLSNSPVTLFDSDGSAVILHKLTDRMQAAGTAKDAGGGRLACGTIEAVKF